ncbi:hypothetical protein B0O99DRAFT_518608 [Bisporella sp. PMI_857]|nr:hypothetical protein B0O99DRAFT_518608 [Bisporella sp. PMI_857]
MPAFSSPSLHNALLPRNVSTPRADLPDNALQVVCAWPVSGQYGPGSRILYYVLVAACVFARRQEWLKKPCLAAALLFPAVAALHGITLSVLHIPGAVDMDLYGAFQLCSIGILAAPVTVKLSTTYFKDPGRNIIFLWTGLILGGLVSLTVEFFRMNTVGCSHDDSGNPISTDVGRFPYGSATCNLTCSPESGPRSPMRGGSADNIYVIPAPNRLTFKTATLLSAACCIPAILSMISMWNKILEINWKSRFTSGDEEKPNNELISGTNGATPGMMEKVNGWIREKLRTAVEVPVFGGAVLAILIMGEINFFSGPVKYQTEPIASIGQWAPMVGTGLALLGSLFVLLAKGDPDEPTGNAVLMHHHCNCSHQNFSEDGHSIATPATAHIRHSFSPDRGGPSIEAVRTISTRPTIPKSESGSRTAVAHALKVVGDYIGTAAPDRFDDSEFRRGRAMNFPEIPGEEARNADLNKIKRQYNKERDVDGNVTPVLGGQRSRASSFNGSVVSGAGLGFKDSLSELKDRSPVSPTTPRRRRDTSPGVTMQRSPSTSSMVMTTERPRTRRDTLEVPSRSRHNIAFASRVVIPRDQSPPAIVVSPDEPSFPQSSSSNPSSPTQSPTPGSP